MSLKTFAVFIFTTYSSLSSMDKKRVNDFPEPSPKRITATSLSESEEFSQNTQPEDRHFTEFSQEKCQSAKVQDEHYEALKRVVEQNDSQAASLLLNEKMHVDRSIDALSFSLLVKASELNHHQIACLLLRHNASPNSFDYFNATPLFHASKNKNCELSARLLEAGADPNLEDYNTVTPLYNAIFTDNLPLIDLLLEWGANAHPKTNLEFSPFELALDRNHYAAAFKLLKAGASFSYDQVNVIAKLLAQYACPDSGCTLLFQHTDEKIDDQFIKIFCDNFGQVNKEAVEDALFVTFSCNSELFQKCLICMKDKELSADYRKLLFKVLTYAINRKDTKHVTMILNTVHPIAENSEDDEHLAHLLFLAISSFLHSSTMESSDIVEILIAAGAPTKKAHTYLYDTARQYFSSSIEEKSKMLISKDLPLILDYVKKPCHSSRLNLISKDLRDSIGRYIQSPISKINA